MFDTGDINKFGPGKFRTRVDNGEEQTCYFNRNKSDTHFTSFCAKRTQAEPIIFSIINHNSDLESIDFNHGNLFLNRQFERELEQANRENIKNGRSFANRSETTKSTNVREQCRKLRRRNSTGESASARKKPRFLK